MRLSNLSLTRSIIIIIILHILPVSIAPLTTPEEAQAFLANMREAQHKRERSHQPPSNLSADVWFLRQRKEEQELRNRRREAETILHNYRSGNQNGNNGNGNSRASWDNKSSSTPRHSSAGSEHGNDTPTDPNDDTESHIAADYARTTAALFATQPLTTKGPSRSSSLPDQEEKKESTEPSSPSQRRLGEPHNRPCRPFTCRSNPRRP